MPREDKKEKIFETIVNEGGDTDTNGALSGTLLGARFGYSGIPDEYISGLVKKNVLERKIDLFIEKMIKAQNRGIIKSLSG